MDVGNRPSSRDIPRTLQLMLRRFALTVLIGFAIALAWEFLLENTVHGFLGIPVNSAGEHFRFTFCATIAVAAVAAVFTYRVPQELALEEAMSKCEAVMRGANDAIFLADLEGNFIDVNLQAERLLGRSREELLKMNFRQIHPPETLDAAEKKFQEMLNSGVTRHTDALVIRADGERVPVDVAGNIIEINGKKKALGIFRDMSLMVAKRKQLYLLETAINRAGEMIIITDKGGIIQYANSATKTVTGYPPAELAGKHIRLFKSGLHRPEFYNNMWNTLLKGGIWKGMLVNRHAKGHNYEVQVTISPIFNLANEITHFVSIQHDMTERKRLYEQVLHADKLSSIGTFMAGVAHELNNPLTVVIGYANELANDKELPPRFTSAAQNIRDQSKRAVEVVRNLLAYSRPHRDGKEPYDLASIVRQTILIHQYRIEMDGAKIEYAPDSEPMNVKVSAGQVQQVLVNLILNAHSAVKSIGKEGIISVSVRRREGWADDFIETVITNNGPAIPPEQLTRIFDPYFTTKKAGEGTGLGLYICAQIVHEHGGDIWAENLPGGAGVAFHFTLPVSTDLPAAPSPASVKTSAPSIAGSRVLFVDDEPLVQAVISKMLLTHEVFPVMAANGEEAAQLLAQGTFDMILSDYKMPVMSGLELYLWVEEHKPEYLRRFVFLTGALEKDLLDFCAARGIMAIIKPAEPEAIMDAVASVIAGGKGVNNGA